jgi:hypothetical protein
VFAGSPANPGVTAGTWPPEATKRIGRDRK